MSAPERLIPPIERRYDEEGVLHCDVELGAFYEGPPGHVHGGATSAIFDQLLGDAVHRLERIAYTGHLEIDYRRPWPLGVAGSFRVGAEHLGGRKLTAWGELRDPDGQLMATARGLWVVPRVVLGADG